MASFSPTQGPPHHHHTHTGGTSIPAHPLRITPSPVAYPCGLTTVCLRHCICADNEVIVNSWSVVNNLPHSIQAFFALEGSNYNTDLGYGRVINVATAHRNFLKEYGLPSGMVPLLKFRPGNWNEPFVEIDRR